MGRGRKTVIHITIADEMTREQQVNLADSVARMVDRSGKKYDISTSVPKWALRKFSKLDREFWTRLAKREERQDLAS